MGKGKLIVLTAPQRRELEKLVAQRNARAGHVRRARVVLMSADAIPNTEIGVRLSLAVTQVSRIRSRFLRSGVEGLADQPKAGRKDHAVPKEMIERIVQMALSPPPAGHARWSTRMIGWRLGPTSATIAKVLRNNDIKLHLARTFKVSRDPKFVAKVRDVVGLYLNPPQNAVVVSVDEKTQIQALERTQLPLPLRPGKLRRHTHDYKRHGVLDLYAALDIATGEVTHRCAESHTAKDFLSFLKLLASRYPRTELHVVLDNSSTHGTPDVQRWLEHHPRVKFHYTPTSASWLNQVEAFFSILSRRSLRFADFPSKTALRRHIEAFLRSWNDAPTPFIWTKTPHRIIRNHRRMLARISQAVH